MLLEICVSSWIISFEQFILERRYSDISASLSIGISGSCGSVGKSPGQVVERIPAMMLLGVILSLWYVPTIWFVGWVLFALLITGISIIFCVGDLKIHVLLDDEFGFIEMSLCSHPLQGRIGDCPQTCL